MTRRHMVLRTILIIITAAGSVAAGSEPSRLKGPWPGIHPPRTTAKLFFPGVICSGWSERDVALSPGMDEIYFGVTLGDVTTIMVTRRLESGEWSVPEVATFARDMTYAHFEPALSPAGKRIYFLTTRPTAGETKRPGWANQNIFYCRRKADGTWGEPRDPGPPLNTRDAEFFPSLSRAGTLYFTRVPAGGGPAAIYRTRFRGGSFTPPEKLPPSVNGNRSVYNACISPDETCLVACVQSAGGPPHPRYQVFFHRQSGWSRGVPLVPDPSFAECPAISASFSPDGRYLFFATRRTAPVWEKGPRTVKWLAARRRAPENGNSDIYWIKADFIDCLRSGKH